MFDHLTALAAPVGAEHVRAWVTELAHTAAHAAAEDGDRSRLDLIGALEELKCAAEGLQADLAVELDASRR